MLLARALYAFERHEEAHAAMGKALRIDPLSMMAYTGAGDGYYFSRDYESRSSTTDGPRARSASMHSTGLAVARRSWEGSTGTCGRCEGVVSPAVSRVNFGLRISKRLRTKVKGGGFSPSSPGALDGASIGVGNRRSHARLGDIDEACAGSTMHREHARG